MYMGNYAAVVVTAKKWESQDSVDAGGVWIGAYKTVFLYVKQETLYSEECRKK